MNRTILILVFITIFTLSNTTLSSTFDKEFKVYDATLYKEKPDIRKYGFNNITVLYGQQFWDKGKSQDKIPTDVRLKTLARKYDGKTKLIVLDIEHWHVQGHPYKPWIINSSIEKYTETFNIFKSSIRMSQVGYFGGIFPISNYKASISSKNSDEYKTWIEDNKKLAGISKIVDVTFPSVYTYSDSIDLWEKSFLAKINQLRSIYSGKIYVFLWPQYFDHAPAPENLQLKYIPADFWRHQLEFSKKHVDGIVIWGGWDFKNRTKFKWDNNAEWLLTTIDFINGNKPKTR